MGSPSIHPASCSSLAQQARNCHSSFAAGNSHTLSLCRRNTYNGKLYKEDANILAWDLLNEPRYTSGGTSAVQNWVDMFAPFIKSQDPNHMVSGASF